MSPLILSPQQITAVRLLAASGLGVRITDGVSSLSSEDVTFLEDLKNGRGLYNPPPMAAFPLWAVTDLAGEFDSGHVHITTTAREYGFALIPAHVWRDQGILEILTVLEYRDTAGNMFDVDFQLESTDNWQSGPEIPDADRGKKPTVWTVHDTWSTLSVAGSTDNAWRQIALSVRVAAGLRFGAVWNQHAIGMVRWSYEHFTRVAIDNPICFPLATPFDPTRDKLVRVTARASALNAGLEIRGASSHATLLHPREGFGLED